MQWLPSVALILASISTGMSGYLLYKSHQEQAQQMGDAHGTALKAYDFSSPKGALVSGMQMRLKGDLRAILEYERMLNRRQLEESLKSLKVHDQAERMGQVVLFYTVDEDGIQQHSVAYLEKDATSGMWRPASRIIGSAIRPSGSTTPEDPIDRKIREWHARNQNRL